MPSNNLISIFDILETIRLINAKSILDIGVGFGKWGLLIREYFDLRPDEKKGYDKWSIKLDGIEANEKYLTPVHGYVYDQVFVGEAIDILSNNNLYYDLILGIDVIEHFTKPEGLKFLNLCRNRARTVFINTPNIYYKLQREYFNPYMLHKSGWDADDFTKLGARYVWHCDLYVLAVFTEDTINLPLTKNIQEYHFEKTDLIKIKELINMYYQTSQFQECLDACEKYSRFFPDDRDLSRMAALCRERLGRFG
ncbi:MAG: hypothetical protein A2W19_15440 [Spirochaetes bacterium RBG_16_49_21]|nr:MAG: hypothetical protein A2W19_15440 [Spirochaetes bacterium RBG_16_49_21]